MKAVLVAALLIAVPFTGASAQSRQFYGTWSVTQTCPDHNTAKGYSRQFNMTVVNGEVSAQYGDSRSDKLKIGGRIKPDGSATLQASGVTSDKTVFNAGNVQGGVAYEFPISARFDAAHGTGTRTKARPCSFTFTKL